jgi:hypothetical protein
MSEKLPKKNSKQMELNLPKSSRVVSPVSRSVSQEVEKEQMTTDISGQKCLESLKSLSQGGLLAKMCEALLVSKTAWYSKQCALTWKVKVTKYKRSIFQLSASAHRTKEKEFGLWRTPDAVSGGSNLPGIQKALDQGHLKRPSGQQIQVRLQDQVKEPRLWPTPRAKEPGRTTKGYGRGLAELVEGKEQLESKKMWPTPTQGMWKQDVNDNGEYAKQCRPKSIQEEGNELECSSSQSGGNFWDIEPDVGRVVNGLPGRVHRLKGLGNAIVPQIAEEIGRAIMKAEQQ